MSTFTQAMYDIKIFVPDIEAPAAGFPVYYVLDGLSYFGFVRDGIRLQHINAPKTGVKPAIVVGICHQKEEMRERRFIDFTAPTENLIIPNHAKGKLPDGYGGADLFMQFIEQELKPMIAEHYIINPTKQTLFGHSLGGYFALWCLSTQTHSFNQFIAISPSIWWNGQELINMSEQFITNGANDQQNRVFIAAGEMEGFMVDDATRLATLLQEADLPVECYIAANENHASIVPTVLSRALRFCSKD